MIPYYTIVPTWLFFIMYSFAVFGLINMLIIVKRVIVEAKRTHNINNVSQEWKCLTCGEELGVGDGPCKCMGDYTSSAQNKSEKEE